MRDVPVIGESAVIPAGSRLVLTSGQVSVDPSGALVGSGDFAAQFHQVFANLAAVMRRAGGDLGDVLKCTTYLTAADHIPVYFAERARTFPQWFGGKPPANTLLVVAALGQPGYLIEVEAIAAVRPGE